MKSIKTLAAALVLLGALTACGAPAQPTDTDAVAIRLSDEGITVNGTPATADAQHGVHLANDIVYYEEGKDFTYGEGSAQDAHSAQEAAAHTVVHISEPGTYRLSGTLSKGQIAVDLGEEAKADPEAVVTLILGGVEVTSEVAPAIIFYNVYECSPADAETAAKDVDTTRAGANVIIEDGTDNTVNGSYVARIYAPESVVLSEDGTEVEDAKKLHKYDGAFYSRMSMNVDGGSEGSGVLTVNAENEGMDSELHLTVNGGNIRINSGNDGINTNEDGVSVTTINGGALHIRVSGETGEGDGIDSNGWLVINGGTVSAQACSFSGDAGIDSDMGIHINGGTVIAGGHMLDRIEDGGQNYAVFTFAETQSGGAPIVLKDAEGASVLEAAVENDFSILVYSSPDLRAGTYTLWRGDSQLAGQSGGAMGRPMMGGGKPFERPEGMERPERTEPPEGMERPERMEPPEGMERPEGGWQKPMREDMDAEAERSTEFVIRDGGNMFRGIA